MNISHGANLHPATGRAQAGKASEDCPTSQPGHRAEGGRAASQAAAVPVADWMARAAQHVSDLDLRNCAEDCEAQGLSLSGAGMVFAGGPVAAHWRPCWGGRGLRQTGCVAACPAAGCSMPESFICRVPISPQVRSGMSNAGVAALRAGMDRLHGVRLLFSGAKGGKGDAKERRHAAAERARIDLAFVHGLAAGYNRGLDAAASGTVF